MQLIWSGIGTTINTISRRKILHTNINKKNKINNYKKKKIDIIS